jgi:uncharacterized phage protein (TIGR01671 family)
MNNRFRFRFWNGRNIIYDDIPNLELYNCDDYVWMQCTGLKDKNGKLIFEGDIVKYAEFDWTDFSFKDWETEIAQVVWGNTYDNYYPAFDLKDTDFDGTNAFAYLFNEGWTIEVIGNIYQDSHLREN